MSIYQLVMPIYLDYAATTPVDQRVAETMWQYLTHDGVFANPSSATHQMGLSANQAVANAREQVAHLIHAQANEIYWTSGATESNNLAIKGVMQSAHTKGKHIITSKIEHRAVLDVCAQLMRQGYDVTYVDPTASGEIPLSAIQAAIRPDTAMISIMYANNITGVVNDITQIGQLAREQGIYFHIDAAQAAGKVPINVCADYIDLMSLASHKLYGPKGIGALYVRRKPRIRLAAQMHGGGQEKGLRGGTLPTHQIAGMGKAFHLANEAFTQDKQHITALSTRLTQGLLQIPDTYINAESAKRLPNILNARISGVASAQLMAVLSERLAFSSGSACSSATPAPDYVLTAMGLSDAQALSSMRLSLGRMTTEAEIDTAIQLIHDSVYTLRGESA